MKKMLRFLVILGFIVSQLLLTGVVSADTAGATGAAQVVHVVRRGETVASVAARYGSSVTAIVKANRLRNANIIWVGQRLVIPGRASTQPAPKTNPATSGRWIDIDLSEQRIRAYEGSKVVLSVLVSTGIARYPTPVGRYTIRTKVRSQAMSGPGYYLPGVQWVMYFYGGYAIHGTYWHNDFGRPKSHGCINLTNANAQFMYNWASIGTPVVIHA